MKLDEVPLGISFLPARLTAEDSVLRLTKNNRHRLGGLQSTIEGALKGDTTPVLRLQTSLDVYHFY